MQILPARKIVTPANFVLKEARLHKNLRNFALFQGIP
jgi:hypothetical protein